ncbi:hypothetical protein KI387_019035 [Taxus chinensis]|uniref:BTB domain-containing protein n=1 Tax=Taxus chinensis TaxID=29808 RepID=A0AA38G6R2_TAXCH|nr:hypothetical protein KI387_019035 [Taxus chinensis]
MANGDATALKKLGDRSTSDVIVRLRTKDGRDDWFYCHSEILVKHGKYFAERLSDDWPTCQLLDSRNCIEVYFEESDFDHHVNILRLIYTVDNVVTDLWQNVKNALGILKVATTLGCTQIISKCVQYLEAVPWEENEEEEIIKTLPSLGSEAIPILARLQPVDPTAVRNVFLSAMHVAISANKEYSNLPISPDELKTSAQEQVEYMLVEDDDAPLLAADDHVKYEVRKHILQLFSIFEKEMASLLSDTDVIENGESSVLKFLSDLLWLCHILPKMDLLSDFVSKWEEASDNILNIIKDMRFSSALWEIKLKVMEITAKVLEAVGYGNVILSALRRTHLVKVWLPFIRETKPELDLQNLHEKLPYEMDNDLFQNIEAAIISLVLALPSSDQAEILADWLKTEQARYPDLSEAFEVWCYRSKAAKRRLSLGLNGVSSTSTVSSVGH